MTPGSVPSLSAKSRALLSAEREILPRPELERRRAALRARTALWHARESTELAGARSALVRWWRRGSLALVAMLGVTSAFAAWVALKPAGAPEDRAVAVASAPQRPTLQRIPRVPAAADEAVQRSPSVPVPSEMHASPSETGTLVEPTPVQNASKSAGVATNGAPRRSLPVSTKDDGTSSQELALLDRARRAVAAGNFRVALEVLGKHARSFPKSQLGEEREALRVRALAGAGLSKKAGQAAREFESSYPKSVLVPELQHDDRTLP